MTVPPVGGPGAAAAGASGDLVDSVHRRLLDATGELPSLTEIEDAVRRGAPLLARGEVDELARRVHRRFDLLGPLRDLAVDGVTEILVDGPGAVRVERHGRLEVTDISLTAPEIEVLVERLLAPVGRRVDPRSPIADARLPDGSRLCVVVAPVAVDGPYLTVRRFGAIRPRLQDFGPAPVVALMRRLVAERRNILVSGGTGAGKTSLLGACLADAEHGERIITLEDAVELDVAGAVRLETRPASVEGVGAVTMRDLVRAALRMRPDRLIVGEVRGAEAFDLLQALNTGHDGSLATIHANGPADAVARLEMLCLLAESGMSHAGVRDAVARAVDVVMHVGRASGGRRRITSVVELAPEPHRFAELVRDGSVSGRPLRRPRTDP